MVDVPGYTLVLAGFIGTFAGVMKGMRVRNWMLFLGGLLVQLGAQAYLSYVVVSNLNGLVEPSQLFYLLAVGSGLVSVISDAVLSAVFVSRAVDSDTSLAIRSVLLFALPGFALAGAGFFRVNWKWSLVAVGDLRTGTEALWPLRVILCLAGLATVIVGSVLGGLLAVCSALSDHSNEKSDRCARVWFALFFVIMPLGSILLGVAAVMAPKTITGGYLLINFIVIGPLVSSSLAMLRDLFKNVDF